MSEFTDAAQAFERLYNIIIRLRSPGGCPWDIAQTPLTMRGDLVEEAFEAVEAVKENKPEHVCEELGDVLLNATMIARMYEEKNYFTVADVCNQVSDKLIRRHPHVFPQSEGMSQVEGQVKTGEEVLAQWDKIKKNVEGRTAATLEEEVSSGLPPLMRANKLQKKAAKKGFDWQSVVPVYDKVREELDEVAEAEHQLNASASRGEGLVQDKKALEMEVGDLLFAVVNLSRHLHIDPVLALEGANRKFCRRFDYVEQKMKENNLPMQAQYAQQMDIFWDEAKIKRGME